MTHPPFSLIRRAPHYLVLALLLVGALALGAKAWRLVALGTALRVDAQALDERMQALPGLDALPELTALLSRAVSDAAALRAEAAPLAVVGAHLSWVPYYGADLAASGALLDLVTNAVTAADETAAALAPVVPLLSADTPDPRAVVAQLMRATPRLAAARSHADAARAAREQIAPQTLTPALRQGVERVDALLPLLDAGTALGVAAGEGASAVAPLLGDDDTAATLPALDLLAAAGPALDRTRTALERSIEAWDRIPSDRISGPARATLSQLHALLPRARDGLDLARELPSLLGADGPRQYLVLAQEPYELRATGGFITAAGILTVERGNVTGFTMRDSRAYDALAPYRYPPAPEPMHQYMGLTVQIFRDANWSPDFPTAARTAIDLYQRGNGPAPQSVIALTPAALEPLLAATGPVVVDGQTVSAENVHDFLYRQDPRVDREKTALSRLGAALITRLHDGVDLAALAPGLLGALRSKAILIYVPDAQASAAISRLGWDGAVRPGSGDFLMPVDMTVSYTKSSNAIARSIDYTADLTDLDAPEATLRYGQRHTLSGADDCHETLDTSDQGYFAGLSARCNWSYLRVLAPQGSELTDAETNPTPGAYPYFGSDDGGVTESDGAAGTHEMATFLVIPLGAQRDTVLRYSLPRTVVAHDSDGWRYRLTVQKQPGVRPMPVTLHIQLPAGASDIRLPVGATIDGADITLETELATDLTFDLRFR